MHYFGVPTCPYCKKRVNLIRVWSLKRQGEYRCPRCGGISNIFLSPLIHVFAVLAIFSGGALYFFHKFILDDITLKTIAQIIIPFAAFYLISLFMVYLVKPVIKKIPRSEMKKKARGQQNAANRRPAAAPVPQMLYDPDEYIPRSDYSAVRNSRTEDDRDMKVVQSSRVSRTDEMQKTSVVPVQNLQRQAPRRSENPVARQITAQPRTSPASQAVQRAVNSKPVQPVQPISVRQPASSVNSSAARTESSVNTPRTVTSVNVPSVTDDFFAKYDDPDYVERRLKEIKEQRGE